MGKIIVIESGSDAAGKATQTKMLYDELKRQGKKVKKISFPNYDSDSSVFVKMYLNGEFGSNPEEIDPYIASTFYALDRYATYIKEIKQYYQEDYIILSDRYTTSNMIYQAGKLKTEKEKDKFIDFLYDFEYNILKLPKPDLTIYLEMPIELSLKLMEERPNKIDGSQTKDIHEKNQNYLREIYENAKYIADKYKFTKIQCSQDQKIKTREEIHSQILEEVQNYLKK